MATARLLIRVESWLLWRRAPRSRLRRDSMPARSLPHGPRDFRSFRASRRPPEIQLALSLGITWVKRFPAIALGAEWFTQWRTVSAAATATTAPMTAAPVNPTVTAMRNGVCRLVLPQLSSGATETTTLPALERPCST